MTTDQNEPGSPDSPGRRLRTEQISQISQPAKQTRPMEKSAWRRFKSGHPVVPEHREPQLSVTGFPVATLSLVHTHTNKNLMRLADWRLTMPADGGRTTEFFFFLAVVCRCRNLLLAPSLPQFVHANTRSVLTHSPPSRGSSSGAPSPPTVHSPFLLLAPASRPGVAHLDLPAIAFPQILGRCLRVHLITPGPCSPRWLSLQVRASSVIALPSAKLEMQWCSSTAVTID